MKLTSQARGVFPIAPTPFLDDGVIDFASIDRLADFYAACGATGITVLGQLGEASKLEHGESLAVAEAYMLMHILERAAQAQLRAMSASSGGRVMAASPELAELTYRQWTGDGTEWDGDDEWPALLRRADRLSPGFRD